MDDHPLGAVRGLVSCPRTSWRTAGGGNQTTTLNISRWPALRLVSGAYDWPGLPYFWPFFSNLFLTIPLYANNTLSCWSTPLAYLVDRSCICSTKHDMCSVLSVCSESNTEGASFRVFTVREWDFGAEVQRPTESPELLWKSRKGPQVGSPGVTCLCACQWKQNVPNRLFLLSS